METYPSEFVGEIVEEYGEDSAVANAAFLGSFSLGNLLSQGVNMDFSPSEVVQLLEEGKISEVIRKAKSCINRRKLHKMWLSIMMDKIRMIEREEEIKSISSPFHNDEVPISKRSVNPAFLSSHI